MRALSTLDKQAKEIIYSRVRPLVVMFDSEMRIAGIHGDPEYYGFQGMERGADGVICMPFLVGLDQVHKEDFHFLETPNGRSVEVNWRKQDVEFWRLLLFDVTSVHEHIQGLQAVANDSRLLKDQLEQTSYSLRQAHARLTRMVSQDALTELSNHRGFHEAFENEVRRSIRNRGTLAPLSLIIADIDYFKVFNDRYGHLAGDQCLKDFAGLVNARLQRGGDLGARVGGEEFAVLLPQTDGPNAHGVAENMRAALALANMPNRDSPLEIVTASFGVATLRDRDSIEDVSKTCADLYQRATSALSRAKEEGRNKVVSADPE